ncbi:hypothetical protein FNH22_30245 [Fulvivirga sp. M361]|uniref:fibronectin type III-like domain-contianing protein n=1 Tax=Fulvivirga sp. M361 TaxID=2594266 RepID=UPI00117BAC6B|nr:fibronectin type III-like domain-contianing protein [Fulvivirga sp. M361]TRX47270.1 hypothetical protein FNH22_30245 [Fulvivirga sp. M361]
MLPTVYGVVELEPLELKGFAKTMLKKGESKTITIEVSPEQLAYYQNGQWVIEPGLYEIKIGASSTDIRLSGTMEITGDKMVIDQRSVLFSENQVQ